jgi:hypothetical protein
MLRRLPVLRLSKRSYSQRDCNMILFHVHRFAFFDANDKLKELKDKPVNTENIQELIGRLEFVRLDQFTDAGIMGTAGASTYFIHSWMFLGFPLSVLGPPFGVFALYSFSRGLFTHVLIRKLRALEDRTLQK